MSLSLTQLMAPLTLDQCRQMLLDALKGLGIVVEGGSGSGGSKLGTGTLTLSGTPAVALNEIIIKIVTAGGLGTAVFQYSLDGGTTYSANVTVPASPGSYVLGTTGVTITFAAGSTGTSFAVGDTFTFAINIQSLPITAWGAASGYRQLVEVDAMGIASLAPHQAALAAGGFTTKAAGAWCDLIGQEFYGISRNLASVTEGLLTLTDANGAGPFTIAAGTMWFASNNGLLYSNKTGGSLAKNGTLQITIDAEQAGSAYNVGNGTIQTIVAGVLPGVTVNNPDPGTGSWITSQGSDDESDSAYMLRCQQRWPSLGTGSTADVYQLWATSSEGAAGHSTTITKSLAQADSVNPGQVNVYLAGSNGAVGAQAVTDAQSYINPRLPITATANIVAATNRALTVAGTVFYQTSKTSLAAVQAAIAAVLNSYIQSLEIGSDSVGTNVKAYYTAIEALVGSQTGVRNLSGFLLNGGTADIGLTTGQVATLTNSLTYTAVP